MRRSSRYNYAIAVCTRSRPRGFPHTGPRSQYVNESRVIPRLSAKLEHNNKHPSSPNLKIDFNDHQVIGRQRDEILLLIIIKI